MKKNVGSIDRMVRFGIAVAAVVISGIVGFGSVGGIILLVVAAIMAVTGAMSSCPIYSVLGMSSCPMPKE